MNKKELEMLIASAVNDAELRSDEIPPIELYVDQIINLHTEKLKEGDERFHDRQITKTMINNYAKDRVITPVKGKKYTKEQIIQILLVYTLKGTLSIGEIKRMLDGAYDIEGFDAASLTALYDKYCDSKDKNRALTAKIVDEMMENNGLDVEKEEDFLVTLASIVSISAFMKNIAQAMIDAKFPPVEEEENKEKKDKKEKSDKEKEKKDKKDKKDKEKKKNEPTPMPEGVTAWG